MATASRSTLLASLPSSPGDLVRERRIQLGLTQAELSELAGIAQGDISKIENGHLDARWSTVKRLSDALESVRDHKTSLASGGYRRSNPASAGDRWEPRDKSKRSVSRGT